MSFLSSWDSKSDPFSVGTTRVYSVMDEIILSGLVFNGLERRSGVVSIAPNPSRAIIFFVDHARCIISPHLSDI